MRDVFAAPFDVEGLAIEARAGSGFAGHDRGWEDIHFELDGAGAFARGAAALGAVE